MPKIGLRPPADTDIPQTTSPPTPPPPPRKSFLDRYMINICILRHFKRVLINGLGQKVNNVELKLSKHSFAISLF